MKLIRCDICGKEMADNFYNSFEMVYDFEQGYEVCNECAKKFSSYMNEKNKILSSMRKELDIKFKEKDKELKEKYGIKFIKNTTEK